MALPLTVPDLVCELDLDAQARETTTDLQTLSQDVLHVLLELVGSNLDDPDRGIGVDQYLSGTEDQLAALPSVIENQLEKDDRIDACSASLDQQADGSWILSIEVQVDGTVLGLQYGYVQGSGLVPLSPPTPADGGGGP